jgi:hypothetical protein
MEEEQHEFFNVKVRVRAIQTPKNSPTTFFSPTKKTHLQQIVSYLQGFQVGSRKKIAGKLLGNFSLIFYGL